MSAVAKRDWSREKIKAVLYIGDGEFSARSISPHFAACSHLVMLLLLVLLSQSCYVQEFPCSVFLRYTIFSDEKLQENYVSSRYYKSNN